MIIMMVKLLTVGELFKRLPITKDGYPVVPGTVLLCPKGHQHEVKMSCSFGGRIYCLKGDCYYEGCQGDSGSGTHYEANECTLVGYNSVERSK
jgi:hypothetical protein